MDGWQPAADSLMGGGLLPQRLLGRGRLLHPSVGRGSSLQLRYRECRLHGLLLLLLHGLHPALCTSLHALLLLQPLRVLCLLLQSSVSRQQLRLRHCRRLRCLHAHPRHGSHAAAAGALGSLRLVGHLHHWEMRGGCLRRLGHDKPTVIMQGHLPADLAADLAAGLLRDAPGAPFHLTQQPLQPSARLLHVVEVAGAAAECSAAAAAAAHATRRRERRRAPPHPTTRRWRRPHAGRRSRGQRRTGDAAVQRGRGGAGRAWRGVQGGGRGRGPSHQMVGQVQLESVVVLFRVAEGLGVACC